MEERRRGSFGLAMAWMLALSILLCLVPIVGPFLAGVVGGRRAREPRLAIGAAILPLLFLAGILTAQSHQGVKVGANATLYLPPLFTWVQAFALLAGAFTGAVGRAPKIAGLALMLVSIGLFQHVVGPIWYTLRKMQAPHGTTLELDNRTCTENLIQLQKAVMIYADSWDDTLPPADRWLTAIKDNVPKDDWLHCPAVSSVGGLRFGYAMNAALGGKKRSSFKIEEVAALPLFYDSSDLSLNAHDNVTSLPAPGRHNGHNNIVYMDGHIAQK